MGQFEELVKSSVRAKIIEQTKKNYHIMNKVEFF